MMKASQRWHSALPFVRLHASYGEVACENSFGQEPCHFCRQISADFKAGFQLILKGMSLTIY